MPQPYVRLLRVLAGSALVTSMLACGGPKSRNKVVSHGEDVLATGPAPQVPDSVVGDLMFAGREMRFHGTTGGDYLGAGGNQTISGRIHGSLRAAGGTTDVNAVIDRNATIAGGNIVLESATVVGRNAYIAGGKIRVDGTIRDALKAAGGSVILNGTVGRDVEVAADDLQVGPRANIAGNLRYLVPKGKVRIDSAARIGGTVTALPVPRQRGSWYLFRALWMLGFLVAGGVVVALLPRVTGESAEILSQRPWWSLLVGFGWFILAPVAMLLVAVTILGVPLALLAAGAYVALAYLGRVPVALWLGQRVLGARVRPGRRGMVMSFLVGGLMLLVILPIPVIGSLAMIVATIIGIGALLLRGQAWRETQREGHTA